MFRDFFLGWPYRESSMCECINPANRLYVCCCGWLKEDWTNDRGKRISLNSGFIERILPKRCIGAEIAVVVSRQCSLSWMLKVCVAESLRLSCLLVCGDGASRKWGWSLCLVQILGIAVWSGCRCCWRRSMMWMHWLQMLYDRCAGYAVLWLTGCVSMWTWSVVLVWAASRSWTRCYRCWLQRLWYRCSDLFNPWLTSCVSMWPRVMVLVIRGLEAIDAVAWLCRNSCRVKLELVSSWYWCLVVQERLLG